MVVGDKKCERPEKSDGTGEEGPASRWFIYDLRAREDLAACAKSKEVSASRKHYAVGLFISPISGPVNG